MKEWKGEREGAINGRGKRRRLKDGKANQPTEIRNREREDEKHCKLKAATTFEMEIQGLMSALAEFSLILLAAKASGALAGGCHIRGE